MGFDRLSPQARQTQPASRQAQPASSTGALRRLKNVPAGTLLDPTPQSGGLIGEFDCVAGQVSHGFAAADTDHTCAGMELPRSLGAAHPVGINAA